jgi:hypothetical protein
VLRVKSNDAAKYVELYVAHLWTRVQFPPPPPNLSLTMSQDVPKPRSGGVFHWVYRLRPPPGV